MIGALTRPSGPLTWTSLAGYLCEGDDWTKAALDLAAYIGGRPIPRNDKNASAEAEAKDLTRELKYELWSLGYRVRLRWWLSPKTKLGVTWFVSRTVAVYGRVSWMSKAWTLAHELGHVRLHAEQHWRTLRSRKTENEIEAETYSLCRLWQAGLLDGCPYARAYLLLRVGDLVESDPECQPWEHIQVGFRLAVPEDDRG